MWKRYVMCHLYSCLVCKENGQTASVSCYKVVHLPNTCSACLFCYMHPKSGLHLRQMSKAWKPLTWNANHIFSWFGGTIEVAVCTDLSLLSWNCSSVVFWTQPLARHIGHSNVRLICYVAGHFTPAGNKWLYKMWSDSMSHLLIARGDMPMMPYAEIISAPWGYALVPTDCAMMTR